MTRSAEYWKRRAEANMDGVQRGAEQRLARLGRAYHQAALEQEWGQNEPRKPERTASSAFQALY